MCNPRRVMVTATQTLDEAWQREITRTVDLRGVAVGEARVRQSLDNSLGGPALSALERALADPKTGWTSVEGGYRRDVEGGYMIYHLDERELEIVAAMSSEIQVTGEASQTLTGTLREELKAEGQGVYYDDGWGGRNEATAQQQADADARAKLEQARSQRLQAQQTHAEQTSEAEVSAAAQRQGQAKLDAEKAARQAELAHAARQQLTAVGTRCRQEFNSVVASAYRDAILAYARTNQASGIHCHETDETIEIEFMVRR